jgi:hypothetical protein
MKKQKQQPVECQPKKRSTGEIMVSSSLFGLREWANNANISPMERDWILGKLTDITYGFNHAKAEVYLKVAIEKASQ